MQTGANFYSTTQNICIQQIKCKRMKKKVKGLGFLLFLFLGIVSCNKTEIETTKDFEKYLEDEMESQHIPALSALIFRGDKVLYESYLGQANISEDIALQQDHPFLLASISKTITAIALIQLHNDGLFSLDGQINDHLPFDVYLPGETTEITFRMLLTHTSGIADGPALDGQYYYGSDSPVELGYFVKEYLMPGGEFYNATDNFYDFEPGTDVEYSNMGNALIAVLVEEISGMNFNAYCKANIFIPLGMTNTHWRLDEATGTVVMPYSYSGGDYEAIGHYTFTDYPNGGLHSTVGDMFKFASALVQNGSYNGHELITPAAAEAMTTPQIPELDNETGLHLFIMNKEHELWGHDGGEQGVATIMGFNMSTNVGALIFTNQGDANLDQILEEAYVLGLEL